MEIKRETFDENVVTMASPFIVLMTFIKFSPTLLSDNDVSFLKIFVESQTNTSH